MWRYLAGAAAMLLLVGVGIFLSRQIAASAVPLPAMPDALAGSSSPKAGSAPEADERSKETRRFDRLDRDKNGAVARDEYLASRKKAFQRLDSNRDGTLSFEEYAIKTSEKFAKVDADRSGVLNRGEFAATRVVRKTPPKENCPPAGSQPAATASDGEAEG